jgi:hypothetical protein
VLGEIVVPGIPMSLRMRCSCTEPKSEKIVGHGRAVVQAPPLVTIVSTSDERLELSVLEFPRLACSKSITSITGERLLRTTLPHDVVAATRAAAIRAREKIRIGFITSCR